MSSSTQRPTSSGLFSLPRVTTLVVSVFVALCCGTNYVYSAYGPQLGTRLGLTHTRQNLVGLSGNMGVYTSGPFLGRLVDAKGPRIPLTIALVLLFTGYFGIKAIFDAGSGDPISLITFCALAFCSYITGIGGNGGLTSAMNATAKSFPDKLRATTAGVVISGFGLSAFLFSTIAHAVFPGNTSDFLLVLAIGTSFPMIAGLFFIRSVPLPETEHYSSLESGEDSSGVDSPSTIFARQNTSHTHLLSEVDEEEDEAVSEDVQLSPSVGHSRRRSRGERLSVSESRARPQGDGQVDLSGRAMFSTFDFWLMFAIMSMLSGTGIMWINNVGSIVQALLAEGNPVYDDVESSKWQSIQVSTISIMNFSGRICIGIIADFAKNRLGLRRAYCISLVSFLFLSSQVAASLVGDVRHLNIASAMLGFAYGGMFGLFPTITIEWFGLAHFSENWGTVSLAPLIGGNLFSLAFGMNLDAHAPQSSSALSSLPSIANAQCVLGVECYISSIHLTIGATFFALLLSVLAGMRDKKRFGSVDLKSVVVEPVVWEADEE